MTLSNFEIWVGIIASIGTIIGHFTGFFKWIRFQLFGVKCKSTNDNPSIVILPKNTPFTELTTFWHMGQNGSNPGMQVVGDFLVTNMTNEYVQLTGAELYKAKVRGMALVKGANANNFSCNYKIPPKSTTELGVQFWIQPPIKKKGEAFSDDVAVIDQSGKKHWIKRVMFKYS